jgi:hypothetical protein
MESIMLRILAAIAAALSVSFAAQAQIYQSAVSARA